MVLTHRESARFIVAVQIPCHRKRRVRIGNAAIQTYFFQLRQIFCRWGKHNRRIAVFQLGLHGFFHINRLGLHFCSLRFGQGRQLRANHFVKTRQTQGIVSNIGTFKHGRSLTCPRSLTAYGHQRRCQYTYFKHVSPLNWKAKTTDCKKKPREAEPFKHTR